MGVGDRVKAALAARREAREEAQAVEITTAKKRKAAAGTSMDEYGQVTCGCGSTMVSHPGIGWSCACQRERGGQGPAVFVPEEMIEKKKPRRG